MITLLIATIVVEGIGNLFHANQSAEIHVSADGQSIEWQATDYFGDPVVGGMTDGIIQVGNLPPGWYELNLTAGQETKKTSFAIVEPTPLSVSAPFGVHTHFAQSHNPAIIPLLAKAGISHIRDEHYWGYIEEHQQGQYQVPEGWQSWMDAIQAAGINPLMVLTWSNPFYDYEAGDFTLPYTANGKQGYVNYALFLLSHYGNRIKAVEVWNEVNAGTFIRGPATADRAFYYTELLKSVYPAIKGTRPDVTVVAGATVPTAHGFFRDIFANGALDYMDAASIHPYGSNESLPLEVEELRNLMGGQVKPIWITEFGIDTGDARRQEAAANLAQTVVMALSANIERIYYYLAQDDGNFSTRGLMADSWDNNRPHPSLVTYSTLIHQLSGATAAGRFATSPSTYAMKFQRGADQITAIWSNFPVTVSLATTEALKVTNVVGRGVLRMPASGTVSLGLSRDVQYIVGPVKGVTEVNATVIADSMSGMTNVQGGNGWFYGYGDASNFTQMEWKIWGTDNYRWIGGDKYPFGDGGGLHPTGGDWAIRRWVSDRSGTVILSGKFSRGGGGDGTLLRILVNGAQIFATQIDPDEEGTYTVEGVQIQPGTVIDFAVDAIGDSNFDATNMTSVIEREATQEVPRPPTNLRVNEP